MKRKRAKEKEKLSHKKEKEDLPHKVWEEITILVSRLKNTLDANEKFDSEFKNKLFQKLLLIGAGQGIFRDQLDHLINSKYAQPKGKVLSDKDGEEWELLADTIHDLTLLLTGTHKKITSQKVKVLRKEVEKEISLQLYKEVMDEKGFTKVDTIELLGSDTLKDGEEIE